MLHRGGRIYALVQIIATMQELDICKEEPLATLRRLRNILQEKITTLHDISIEDKKQICRLYNWFIIRSHELRSLDSISEIKAASREIDINTRIEEPGDIIESLSGNLIPSVEDAFIAAFRDLSIPLSYSVSRRSNVPITLYVPADKIPIMLEKLPVGLNHYSNNLDIKIYLNYDAYRSLSALASISSGNIVIDSGRLRSILDDVIHPLRIAATYTFKKRYLSPAGMYSFPMYLQSFDRSLQQKESNYYHL